MLKNNIKHPSWWCTEEKKRGYDSTKAEKESGFWWESSPRMPWVILRIHLIKPYALKWPMPFLDLFYFNNWMYARRLWECPLPQLWKSARGSNFETLYKSFSFRIINQSVVLSSILVCPSNLPFTTSGDTP